MHMAPARVERNIQVKIKLSPRFFLFRNTYGSSLLYDKQVLKISPGASRFRSLKFPVVCYSYENDTNVNTSALPTGAVVLLKNYLNNIRNFTNSPDHF